MPHPVSSFRLRALLALGTALFFALLWWATTATHPRPLSSARRDELPSKPTTPHRSTASERLDRVAASVGTASKTEIVRYVLATYRKEQLTRELDLEQQRYGTNYWNPDRNGRELARIRADRAALIAALTNEANDVLASVLPREEITSITLIAFFDDDHPGPNVAYLSPESRQRFEAALLASGSVEPQAVADAAAAELNSSELAQFHAWNDRANAALRNELVGFDATEREFLAIREGRANGDAEATRSSERLEEQLGRDRYTQLTQLETPAVQTAVNELNRLGLPLTNAAWLASTREAAAAEIQQVWQDKTLSTATKSDRVALLHRELGQAIAAKLALPGSDLDELGVAQ